MDRSPFQGRIALFGGANLPHVARTLLLAHLEMPPDRIVVHPEGRPDRLDSLGPGDLLIDPISNLRLRNACRERGILYLTSTARTDREPVTTPGPTAVLGHGASPGLVAHFARIALRDIASKAVRTRPEDPGAAELAKLLQAGDFSPLARALGVRKLRCLAPPNHHPGERAVLGVLVRGHTFRAWWTGSILDDNEAGRHVPGCDASTLQVAAGLLSAALWMLRNPQQGTLEAKQLPHEEILEVALPYLGVCTSRSVDVQSRT